MNRKIETYIDKKTIATYFEKYAYFNKLSAEIRLLKDKKTFELISLYNNKSRELAELRDELENNYQKCPNEIKSLEKKFLIKQMEC